MIRKGITEGTPGKKLKKKIQKESIAERIEGRDPDKIQGGIPKRILGVIPKEIQVGIREGISGEILKKNHTNTS